MRNPAPVRPIRGAHIEQFPGPYDRDKYVALTSANDDDEFTTARSRKAIFIAPPMAGPGLKWFWVPVSILRRAPHDMAGMVLLVPAWFLDKNGIDYD